MQKSRGYALGLALVKYNQKLAFHHGDTIIKTPSFPLLRSSPRSIVVPIMTYVDATCKENGPLAHLLWILVFDDQHNQIELMNLQVIVL